MIDKELIKNKMADIQEYHKELASILNDDVRNIMEDKLKLHSIERLFQLMVDTSIDINTHIIIESGFTVPNDYQNTFITLAENKIFPMDFGIKIAPSVGLRNLLIHRYGKVDLKRMIEDIKNEIGDYLEYLRHVNEFLKRI